MHGICLRTCHAFTRLNASPRSVSREAVAELGRSAKKTMRILISGGPGSGCTSTASAVGAALDLPVFDSDSFFHKPTDPPFQQQYSSDERRDLLKSALSDKDAWILSGSIATWGLSDFASTHGVFLEIPCGERLKRLGERQRTQFGSRIEPGGDMAEEHRSFLEWADGYESRTGAGRNLTTDRAFMESRCDCFMSITEVTPFQEVVTRVIEFLNEPPTQNKRMQATPTSPLFIRSFPVARTLSLLATRAPGWYDCLTLKVSRMKNPAKICLVFGVIIAAIAILGYIPIWQDDMAARRNRERVSGMIAVGENLYEAEKKLRGAGFDFMHAEPIAPTVNKDYLQHIVIVGSAHPNTFESFAYAAQVQWMPFVHRESPYVIIDATLEGKITEIR